MLLSYKTGPDQQEFEWGAELQTRMCEPTRGFRGHALLGKFGFQFLLDAEKRIILKLKI